MLKANLGEIFFLKYQPHLMVFIIFNVHILICKQRQDGEVVNVSVSHAVCSNPGRVLPNTIIQCYNLPPY